MALIERHPDVEDYIVELSLDEIAARPDGVMDLFEDGHLIVIKDYRLPFDLEAMERLDKQTDGIEDPMVRRRLKKLESTRFFEGKPPVETPDGGLRFSEPVRQALYDSLCRGDRSLFERSSAAFETAHEELGRIFKIAFPTYQPFRLIPSLRLTETLFENLHWDNHSIDDDFQQARIFCNIDTRRRIWTVGPRFLDFMAKHYKEHDLGRFAGGDPNKMVDYFNALLGGMREKWKDTQARHRIAFEPGEVWIGESRMISHQIFYGERAMVYMWFVDLMTMKTPGKRFNARIEALHDAMRERRSSSAVAAA